MQTQVLEAILNKKNYENQKKEELSSSQEKTNLKQMDSKPKQLIETASLDPWHLLETSSSNNPSGALDKTEGDGIKSTTPQDQSKNSQENSKLKNESLNINKVAKNTLEKKSSSISQTASLPETTTVSGCRGISIGVQDEKFQSQGVSIPKPKDRWRIMRLVCS